ncbi:unnamed protein product [Closterium sp. Yama58-4]|nr:unnamed protein product [Closterium sp. Yama58-4]
MMEVRQMVTDDPVGGWDKAWQASATPWDLGGVTPAVAALVAAQEGSPLHLPSSIRRVLVPGCGTSTHAPHLPLSAYPASINAHMPHRPSHGPHTLTPPCTILPCWLAPMSLPTALATRSFFCALAPSLRGKWAAKTAELLLSRLINSLHASMPVCPSHRTQLLLCAVAIAEGQVGG